MSRFQSVIVVAVIILLVAFLGGLVWGNLLFTRTQPGGASFAVYWASGRTLLYSEGVPQPTEVFPLTPTPATQTPTVTPTPGLQTPTPTSTSETTLVVDAISPYGDFAAENVQKRVYGRLARDGESPLHLDLPMHIETLVLPLAAIDDFGLARAVWALILEMALLATCFLCVSAYQWKPGVLILSGLMLFSLFWVHGLWPLVLGDASIMLAMLIALSFAALANDMDELAGVALALATFKLTSVGLFLVFVLLWMLINRRWRFLVPFFLTLGITMAVSYIFFPGWFWPYARAQLANLRALPGYTPARLLIEIFPAAGERLGYGVTIIVAALMFNEWWHARRADLRHFFWTASLTLAITPLSGLPTFPQNYIIFLPGIALALSIMTERWLKTGRMITYAVLVAVFAGFWLILFSTGSTAALFLPVPLTMLLLLYWVRWWAVRPPRTWADKIRGLQ